jgi:general secretion pathway protein G
MHNRTQPIVARSRAAAGAFTLMEMIVVVIIIAVLATAIGPSLWKRIGSSKQAVAANNAMGIVAALNLYQADNGSLPESGNLGALCAKATGPDSKGPWLENCDMLKDPWGRQFILIVPGQKNSSFDVVSYGADGKPGGGGEDADIIKP